jgi:hypothetical protein
VPKRDEPTEADFKRARELTAEFRVNLPAEFTVAARTARVGEVQFPDLHFKADPVIPGLFRAQVDPDFIMGRTREPMDIKELTTPQGNGNSK